MSEFTLHLGRWEDVLAGVEVDSIITDPPYSKRTHDGHDAGATLANRKTGWMRKSAKRPDVARSRREINYARWTANDVDAFIDAWAPRCRGWMVCLSDSDLCGVYRAAYERNGLTGFQPVGILIPGMTVRMAGDGPSSWMLYANVGRPKALSDWGTLPGGYTGTPSEGLIVGDKPLWLMQALVRHYTRRGDLVCDPCAGSATTLLAALIYGRRAVGAEVDPATHDVGLKRLSKGYTPVLFSEEKPTLKQRDLFGAHEPTQGD